MLIALEGIAGSGKTTLRDRVLALAEEHGVAVRHIGQFSWLSLAATRALVDLRAGRAPVAERDATAAVLTDLTLHSRHNLAPASVGAHVLADRLVLSSACLLALAYAGPVERHIEALARVWPCRPDLTVLLTTPVDVCARRLATRPAANRVGDDLATATRLQSLYEHCADAWQRTTGMPVRRYQLNTHEDTERLARALLYELEGTTIR
ncbi:dTMP kinase [Nocardia gipuzkoensis]